MSHTGACGFRLRCPRDDRCRPDRPAGCAVQLSVSITAELCCQAAKLPICGRAYDRSDFRTRTAQSARAVRALTGRSVRRTNRRRVLQLFVLASGRAVFVISPALTSSAHVWSLRHAKQSHRCTPRPQHCCTAEKAALQRRHRANGSTRTAIPWHASSDGNHWPLAERLRASLDGTTLFDARIARVDDLNGLPGRAAGGKPVQRRKLRELITHRIRSINTLRLERRRRPASGVALQRLHGGMTRYGQTMTRICAARVRRLRLQRRVLDSAAVASLGCLSRDVAPGSRNYEYPQIKKY